MIVSFTWMASRLGSRWGRDVGANHVAVLGRAPQDCTESDSHEAALRFLEALGTIRTMRRAPRTFKLRFVRHIGPNVADKVGDQPET